MLVNKDSQNRIMWCDNAKAIGILLVVLGHSIRDEMRMKSVPLDYIYQYIYFFHMSLFFALSGFLLERSLNIGKNKCDLIKRKIQTLFIPFLCYSVLIFIIFESVSLIPMIQKLMDNRFGSEDNINFIKYLTLSLIGNNPYAFHMWFLLSLFIVEIGMIIFDSAHCIYIALIVGWLLHISPWYPVLKDHSNIMLVSAIMQNFIFLAIGRIIYKYRHRFEIRWTALAGLLMMGSIIFNLSFKFGFTGGNIYKIMVLKIVYLIGKICLVFFVIGLSQKMQERNNIIRLGQNSFAIYLLHQPFCCGFLGLLLYNYLHISSIFTITICIISSVVFPIEVKHLLCRNERIHKISKCMLNI